MGRVGVAGLTLGCGLSAFSGKRGFACDNVKAFQVSINTQPLFMQIAG